MHLGMGGNISGQRIDTTDHTLSGTLKFYKCPMENVKMDDLYILVSDICEDKPEGIAMEFVYEYVESRLRDRRQKMNTYVADNLHNVIWRGIQSGRITATMTDDVLRYCAPNSQLIIAEVDRTTSDADITAEQQVPNENGQSPHKETSAANNQLVVRYTDDDNGSIMPHWDRDYMPFASNGGQFSDTDADSIHTEQGSLSEEPLADVAQITVAPAVDIEENTPQYDTHTLLSLAVDDDISLANNVDSNIVSDNQTNLRDVENVLDSSATRSSLDVIDAMTSLRQLSNETDDSEGESPCSSEHRFSSQSSQQFFSSASSVDASSRLNHVVGRSAEMDGNIPLSHSLSTAINMKFPSAVSFPTFPPSVGIHVSTRTGFPKLHKDSLNDTRNVESVNPHPPHQKNHVQQCSPVLNLSAVNTIPEPILHAEFIQPLPTSGSAEMTDKLASSRAIKRRPIEVQRTMPMGASRGTAGTGRNISSPQEIASSKAVFPPLTSVHSNKPTSKPGFPFFFKSNSISSENDIIVVPTERSNTLFTHELPLAHSTPIHVSPGVAGEETSCVRRTTPLYVFPKNELERNEKLTAKAICASKWNSMPKLPEILLVLRNFERSRSDAVSMADLYKLLKDDEITLSTLLTLFGDKATLKTELPGFYESEKDGDLMVLHTQVARLNMVKIEMNQLVDVIYQALIIASDDGHVLSLELLIMDVRYLLSELLRIDANIGPTLTRQFNVFVSEMSDLQRWSTVVDTVNQNPQLFIYDPNQGIVTLWEEAVVVGSSQRFLHNYRTVL